MAGGLKTTSAGSSPNTHEAGEVGVTARVDTLLPVPPKLVRKVCLGEYRITANLIILYGRPEWTRTIDLFRVKEAL